MILIVWLKFNQSSIKIKLLIQSKRINLSVLMTSPFKICQRENDLTFCWIQTHYTCANYLILPIYVNIRKHIEHNFTTVYKTTTHWQGTQASLDTETPIQSNLTKYLKSQRKRNPQIYISSRSPQICECDLKIRME